MAEVVGLVASGISIVQLAGQIAASIAKLQGYWKQLNQAPSDIKDVLSYMDDLSLLLNQIQNYQGMLDYGLDHFFLQQCLKRCEECSKELHFLIEDLERLLEGDGKWKRKVGALKVVLKKSDVKRLQQKLKNAVRLLQLAQGCYTNASLQLLPKAIVAGISESFPRCSATTCHCPNGKQALNVMSSERSKQSSPRNISKKPHMYWGFTGSWLVALVGSLEYQKDCKKYRGKPRAETNVKYYLPSWLARRLWDVVDLVAYQDRLAWRMNLQAYRQVPLGEPIFRVATKGELETMRDLLRTRRGFVNDRDERGFTPLHYAARHGHYEVCQLLISERADVLAESDDNWTPLECAAGSDKDVQPVALEKTIRVLIAAGSSDDLIQDHLVLRNYSSCSADVFTYLSQQCYPPYHQASAQECVNVAVDLASCGLRLPADGDSFRVFQLALKPVVLRDVAQVKTDTDLNEVTTRSGMTLLHACAIRLRIETDRDIALDKAYWRILNHGNPWRVFIKALIIAGAEISAVDSGAHSPFHELLSYFSNYPLHPEGPEEVLKAWLNDLKEAGVDLQLYGKTEFALHQALAKNSECCRYFSQGVTFKYGPQVEDWHFRLKWPMNDFAAQFWRMVEKDAYSSRREVISDKRQGIDMPGSWRDFDSENNSEDEGYD